jgi:hypothetical protein
MAARGGIKRRKDRTYTLAKIAGRLDAHEGNRRNRYGSGYAPLDFVPQDSIHPLSRPFSLDQQGPFPLYSHLKKALFSPTPR